MLSLGYSEYVTQGGDWGYAVRFVVFLTLVMRPDCSTILLVDGGHGISLWSPARQSFAYQCTYVGWF